MAGGAYGIAVVSSLTIAGAMLRGSGVCSGGYYSPDKQYFAVGTACLAILSFVSVLL